MLYISDTSSMMLAPLPKRQAGHSGDEMDKPSADLVQKAFHICKEYLTGSWSRMTRDDFQLTPLGGGLTNKLYICTLLTSNDQNKDDDEENKELSAYPTTILLRIYGLILQDFKAQIQESVVFSILAERSIGPHLFAVFPGGRLEEYLPSRTLKTRDLCIPDNSRNIAIRMSEYHRLTMPVKKSPSFVMSKLHSYLEKTSNAQFEDKSEQELFEKFMKNDINKEVEYLKDLVSKLNAVVLFCHNDVQEGNLLHTDNSEDGNPIQMIDFEYSSYNYRGFDIGNHFCEWMYDYSHPTWPFYTYQKENYPDKDQQLTFIESYLQSMYTAMPSRKKQHKWSFDVVMYETDRLVLLSHLFWALWSIRQAQISDIQFGYLDYALARMDAYFRHKQLLE